MERPLKKLRRMLLWAPVPIVTTPKPKSMDPRIKPTSRRLLCTNYHDYLSLTSAGIREDIPPHRPILSRA